MTNEIKIFENIEFGKVRTVLIDGEPWFVGKDICQVFGDKNHNRSIGRVDDVDKRQKNIVDSLGREQKAIFVNESGLYSLLFAMQPQKAHNDGVSDEYPIEVQKRIEKIHKFKHWVTSEVLPSIRKHGAYITGETLERALSDPDFLIRLATELKTEKEKRIAVEKENKQLVVTNEVLVSDTLTWADRNLINAVIRRYGFAAKNGRFDFAWTEWKKELLYKYGINVNARITAKMNTQSKKPKTLDVLTEEDLLPALKTAVSLCENENIDVSDLLLKRKAS